MVYSFFYFYPMVCESSRLKASSSSFICCHLGRGWYSAETPASCWYPSVHPSAELRGVHLKSATLRPQSGLAELYSTCICFEIVLISLKSVTPSFGSLDAFTVSNFFPSMQLSTKHLRYIGNPISAIQSPTSSSVISNAMVNCSGRRLRVRACVWVCAEYSG